MPSYHTEPPGKLNLAKWGIKFDGTSKTMNVQEFIFRVGELKRDYDCPEDEFLTKFHQLLDRPALDWYWNHRKFVHISSWRDLEKALVTQYQQYENEFQIQMKILNRRQLPHEHFEDFYNAVLQLRNQQKTPYAEAEMVQIMRGNLKPSLAQMIFSARLQTLGEFCREVKRAENLLFNQRQQYQRPNNPPRINELSYDEELPQGDLEIEAIREQSRQKCWNCEREGHSWVDCTAPRKYFCYRCGHDGVTVVTCPKCQGNRSRNSSQIGEMRPTQN